MLVADMALIYDFEIDEETGFAECEVTPSETTCDFSDMHDTINSFAEVNQVIRILLTYLLIKIYHFRIMICGSLLIMLPMTK